MFDEQRFSNDGTEASRPWKPDNGDNQMKETMRTSRIQANCVHHQKLKEPLRFVTLAVRRLVPRGIRNRDGDRCFRHLQPNMLGLDEIYLQTSASKPGRFTALGGSRAGPSAAGLRHLAGEL